MSRKSENDRIIRRVKGLLNLAKDNSNLEESQSAFMQAQQMMVKYGVDPEDLDVNQHIKDILTKSVTPYKRLYWWERSLATVMADNFRCRWYYSGQKLYGDVQMKRQIVFVGYEDDVELAKEMYHLASSALAFYTKQFLRKLITHDKSQRTRAKNDFIRGFIDGLQRKFEEQIKKEQWGLVLVVPKAVEEKTAEITKNGKAIAYTIPALKNEHHYEQGFQAGNRIDYTKSTIDD